MGAFLFILLLGIPIAELYVIVQVSDGIGFLNTLALLIVISIAGAVLLKQQGLATWRQLQATLAAGRMPAKQVTDGALIIVGGALLLTPGFLTDAVGLLLLLPPSRAAIKGAFRGTLARWAKRRYAPGLRIYETTAGRSRRRDAEPRSEPRREPSLDQPSPTRPGEADSPDRD